MTRKLLVMACCVLVSAASVFAQSRGTKTKADPISGTWTHAGSMAARRCHLTATLIRSGVLVAGGQGASGDLASAEIFSPR